MINKQSQELSHVLEKIPNNNITKLFIAILTILGVTIFFVYQINYPRMLRGSFDIVSNPLPIELSTPVGGEIHYLTNIHKDFIHKETEIAVIDLNNQYYNMLEYSNLLDEASMNHTFYSNLVGLQLEVLKESQIAILNILNSYFEIRRAYYSNLEQEEIEIEEKEVNVRLEALRDLYEINISESKIKKERHSENKELFFNNNLMKHELVGSSLEIAEMEKTMTIRKRELKELDNRIDYLDLQQKKLRFNYYTQKKDLRHKFNIAIGLAKSKLSAYFDGHIINSPIDGRIEILNEFANGQRVDEMVKIFRVIPSQTEIRIQGYLHIEGYAQVKIGHHVNLKLADYPYKKYGYLEAIVSSKDHTIYENGMYKFSMKLRDGLESTNGFCFEVYDVLVGECEVLLEKRNLLESIFDDIKSLSQ